MTGLDFFSLTPFLIIAMAPVLIMINIAFSRNHQVTYGFSVFAFSVAFVSLFLIVPALPHEINPLFIIDQFSLLFLGIIFLSCIVIVILSYHYFEQHRTEKEEYYVVLFIAALGASILTVASHFATFFLGLETLSIAVFVMIAYLRSRDYSIEASMKYLIMASVSSAFLLFGMALIYAATGTMIFKELAVFFQSSSVWSPIALIGFAMILVSLGFKLALVPFHMWTPDVYQGAPVPVTAFIATVSKSAVMALIIRFFYNIDGVHNAVLFISISGIAILSMFAGNLLAVRQQNMKRLLAYSSISHLGYLLVTLLMAQENGPQTAVFYVIIYSITSLGAFSVISLVSSCDGDRDQLESYKGLFWSRPWLALVLTLSMLSLAGIPLTAGFISKFYLVLSGVKSNLWLLMFSLIINSVIGLYYYLKVITTMFSGRSKEHLPEVSMAGYTVLTVVSSFILLLGIFPGWLLNLIAKFAVIW